MWTLDMDVLRLSAGGTRAQEQGARRRRRRSLYEDTGGAPPDAHAPMCVRGVGGYMYRGVMTSCERAEKQVRQGGARGLCA